ncbi:MAG TPA: TusE/DsrC/DsvC family sulfur relay protein [Anaeromyxobacteraceae bacterium]|nr:TusE/DsrC/DsvC family sulfur relay protein [Anaeromyxobacteraceae bacterium]
MGQLRVNENVLELDEDGFIQQPEKWDNAVALALAETEGVSALTPQHWKLVNYLRDYYLKFGAAPMIRKVCKDCDMKLNEIYALFPSGPAKGACKVAGLPKPTGCV